MASNNMQAHAGSMFKNIRRTAEAEIRKVKGGGESSSGGDGSVEAFEEKRQRYEHLVNLVQSMAKEMRGVASSQLSLAQKGNTIELKVKEAGQLLTLTGGTTNVDTEIIPSFTAAGVGMGTHVSGIQDKLLPCFDRIVESNKALAREMADNKQKRVEYEHYVHKVQGLEEATRTKNSPKEFERLESNKSKLNAALAAYQASSNDLNRQLDRATQARPASHLSPAP